jgi:hypothetical protein
MAAGAGMFTELYVAAFDEKALSMDESVSKLSAGAVVNPRDGRAGHVHLGGALLLRQPEQIDQADDFVFIDAHDDDLCVGCAAGRGELAGFGQRTDAAAPRRSRHGITSLFSDSVLL